MLVSWLFQHYPVLKMEVKNSSETPVKIYQSRLYHTERTGSLENVNIAYKYELLE
jgi:hypothetical protein